MRKKQPPYQLPKAPYKPGQWVKYQGVRFQVTSSTHTHTQLLGIEKAIANWELKK